MQPNTVAAALTALYLALILIRGNEKKFAALILGESDFVKWLAALAIILAVSDKIGDAGKALVALVYTAMLLRAVKQNPKTFDNLASIFAINK